jgi:futalosine hydrolase
LKILLVSATEKEVNLLIQHASNLRKSGPWQTCMNIGNSEIEVLISGIGIPSTLYRLTSVLVREKYDLVLNIGLAGSFRDELKMGSVVHVISEQFGDLGVDDNGQFLTLFEMANLDQNSNPYSNGLLINPFDILKYKNIASLPKMSGITVNKVSGEQFDISKKWTKFGADIESTEGAAVFYVCLLQNVPFIEIRAISNKIEPRNPKNWNVPLALINLDDKVLQLLHEMGEK